jgi:hypothetical protein
MSNIIEPDTKFIPRISSSLEPQIDWAHASVILGRGRSSVKKYGLKDTLQLGVICEQQNVGASLFGYKVQFDNKFPHIIFICGKRGSGKSYSLGVIVEELGRSKSGIGAIVIDPLGTFWTMKNKNQSEKDAETLAKYGIYPKDFNNIQVLTPTGFYEEMKESVDGAFSIAISDLSADDWCLVFDIDRFKTQGLLIGDVLDKVNNGYFAKVDKMTKKIPPKKVGYTIGDIIFCIQNDVTINSPEEGYASGTRRSVIARFRAAGKWGIFSVKGTPLNKITLRNWITILDVSHSKLGSSRRALLVGILARKILEGRIEASRMEEATEMGIDVKGKETIPVTWLIIDEAHLLLPSSGKTAASESLIEYAKLGRKPGCGLVLATQRPAATNDDILSQVDTILGHNLALEDDIAALRRRIPAKIPQEFNNSDFIRSIPVGTCLLADQKTQQRTMLVQIRPRMTHHSGRAALPKSDEERERLRQRQGIEPDEIETEIGKTYKTPERDLELDLEPGSSHDVDQLPIDFKKEDDSEVIQDDIMGTTTNLSELERKIEAIQKYTEEQDSDQTSDFADDFKPDRSLSGDVLKSGNMGEVSISEQKIMGIQDSREQFLGKVDLEWGGAYIISSKDPEFGLNILNNFSKKSSGQYLSITRTHPKKLNSNLLPDSANRIWLSKSSGDNDNAVAPGNITKLAHIIHDFLNVNKNGIIFLDGVEYLISNNDFPKILKFIEMIHEKIVLSNGILLIPVNPSAMPKNNLDLLENELSNKIEDSGYGETMDAIPQKSGELIEVEPKLEDENEISMDGPGVRVATKNELKALCKKLGLNTSGTVEDLKKRLMEYEEYSAVALKEAEPESKKGKPRKTDKPEKTKKPDLKSKSAKVSEKAIVDAGSVDFTDKERALLTAIAEERGILESLLSERKRLEDDISKLRQAERKQKMQLERQKILEEREKLKRDRRELEDERKKLEKRLRLTIKQVAEAQKPTELPDKIEKIDKSGASRSTSKKATGKPTADKGKLRDRDIDLRDIDGLLSKTTKRSRAIEPGSKPGTRGSGKLRVLKEPVQKVSKKVPGKIERQLPAETFDAPKSKGEMQRITRSQTTKPKKPQPKHRIKEIDKAADEKKDLMVKPRFNLDNIEEYAMKHLKTSILGKPLEVIKDIKLIFLPLLRVHVKTMRGTIFAKEYSGTFYWDTVTGEIIIDLGNVMKRSKGLAMLMSLTPSQAKVLANLDTWGYDDVVDLESETNMSVAQIKRTLTGLQKKSLVVSEKQSDKRIYSYKRMVELKYPQKFDKVKVDMHQIIKGMVDKDIISSQYKLKDLEKLLLSLKPGTRLVSDEEVYYPYFKIDIIGKQGPRTVMLDSVSGSQDKILTEYLDIKGLN